MEKIGHIRTALGRTWAVLGVVLCWMISSPACAQEAKGLTIKGRVNVQWTDTMEEGACAKVLLLKNDSIIQGRTSDFEGLFCFKGIEPGRYQIQVHSYYGETVQEIEVEDSQFVELTITVPQKKPPLIIDIDEKPTYYWHQDGSIITVRPNAKE